MNINQLITALNKKENKTREVNAIIVDKAGNIVVFSVEGNTKAILDTLKMFDHS